MKTAADIRKEQVEIHKNNEEKANDIINKVSNFIKQSKDRYMEIDPISSEVKKILEDQGFVITIKEKEYRGSGGYDTESIYTITW